ncbi:DNA-directed RNA polymerase subunit beta, partial [Mesotoga prima]|uniref:DNA-directed RNA polymerase subunit beta n=1 Tax=Mesotoga prima TaxID=1184387 RepID=UPI002C5C1875
MVKKITYSLQQVFAGLELLIKEDYRLLFEKFSPEFGLIETLEEPSGSALAKFSFEFEEDRYSVGFKVLNPDQDGAFSYLSKMYSTPLVLLEKRGRSSDYLDLENFWVVPGYYLRMAFVCLQALRELQSKNGMERLDTVLETAETLLNRTVVGTEILKQYDKGEIEEEPEIKKAKYLKVPILFELPSSNGLLQISELRKAVIPGDKVKESLRLPHFSHLGKLDLLETPESVRIGMNLFLANGARYNASNLEIESSGEDSEALLSPSTCAVPFMAYSDGVRVTMGGKNLKQAVKVVSSEKPIIRTPIDEEVDLDYGVNALAGYALFNGLNFEDGIVCSEGFATKMCIVEKKSIEIVDSVPVLLNARVSVKNRSTIELSSEEGSIRVVYNFRTKGSIVNKGDWLIRRNVFFGGNDNPTKSYSKNIYYDLSYPGKILQNPEERMISFIMRTIPTARKIKKGEKLVDNLNESVVSVSVPLTITKPLEIGDKITGRHGNKGTISKIVSDREMPHVEIDGQRRPLDIILSPFGVITRMNLGQLLETHKSLEGEYVDRPFKNLDLASRVAEGKDIPQLKKRLFFADGTSFEAAVGYQYFVRLDHCVRDKLHVVDLAETSEITGQPVKGKRREGGQRIGEMEFWTLFDNNALETVGRFSQTNISDASEFRKRYFDTFRLLMNYYRDFDVEIKDDPLRIIVKETSNDFLEKVASDEIMSEFFKQIKGRAKDRKERRFLLSKSGYLRKYMLGRRIHFSGRTVITPVTDIDIDHVYLPYEFAKLWLPLKEDSKEGIKIANDLAKESNLYVLLNRQPSLHRHSISSARPIFWENKTIGLPIMLCDGFGADFDGDSMAVYLPVDQDDDLKRELKSMLPSNNPFRIGTGELTFSVTQDLVYGLYRKRGLNSKKVKEELTEIIENSNNISKDLLKWQNESLAASNESELSLDLSDIALMSEVAKSVKDSGSRGKSDHFIQMAEGIDLDGRRAEAFARGVSIEDYLGRTGGLELNIASRSRTGLIDKKLHVAEAGYFTRKLVEFLYPVSVAEEDCGTDDGIELKKSFIEHLEMRKYSLERLILGRYVRRPMDKEWMPVTRSNLNDFRDCDLLLRSPVKCASSVEYGICSECAGLDLSSMKKFRVGSFLGVLSGHTIGERGTQLSMKTFQTGSSGFSMQRVSSEFFKAEEEFSSYLKRLADRSIEGIMKGSSTSEAGSVEEGSPVLGTIDVASIYLEVLFRHLKDTRMHTEGELKKR